MADSDGLRFWSGVSQGREETPVFDGWWNMAGWKSWERGLVWMGKKTYGALALRGK
jgi:hypothetical protein